MTCADGARLATRLWRPPWEAPAPVLLMRQPYGRAIASTVTYAHPSWYAAHGFLVVIQDVRGRGGSEGQFAGFAQEAKDGAEAVRWVRRLPGANGKVGLYGFSYQGLTQLLNDPDPRGGPPGAQRAPAADGSPRAAPTSGAAASPLAGHAATAGLDDPWPDCLAPACCGLDERLHWASEGGAHWWALGLGWALQLAAEGCRRRGDEEGWRAIRQSLDSGTFLRDGPALLERLDSTGMGLAWLRLDPLQPRPWQRHPVAAGLLRRPLLLIGAWHDPHLRGTLDLYWRARRAGGQPWLRIGAWTHLDWRGGLDPLQLAFFKAHLMEPAMASQGPQPQPALAAPLRQPGGASIDPLNPGERLALQVGEEGPWRRPLPDPPRWVWRLASNGLAAVRSDEGRLLPQAVLASAGAGLEPNPKASPHWEPGGEAAPPLVLVHDPWRPVPGRGGHLGLDAGVVCREDLDRRADVACFSTAPLSTALLLQGVPRLAIAVAADQPGFDLSAALSLLLPDGRALQISTGTARFLGDHCLLQRRRRVDLQPLLRQVLPGQRLRLSLAAAAWPQVAVNPGDGRQPTGAVGVGHRQISLSFDLNRSRLWLTALFGAN